MIRDACLVSRVSCLRIEHRQQRFTQLFAQQRITVVDGGAEGRLGGVEFAPHLHILRALTGEEKGQARPRLDGGTAQDSRRLRPHLHLDQLRL